MTAPAPEPSVHRMCANCGHIRHESDDEAHFSMPSMGLRCSGRGTADSPIFQWIAPLGAAWDQFVSAALARWESCPDCGQRVRVRRNGRLVTHQRPPRAGDRARRRWVDCAGAGVLVPDASPDPTPNLSTVSPS